MKDLIDDELGCICEVVDGYKVEGDLCCEINLNIKCLMEILLYCGICYCCGLLVCG